MRFQIGDLLIARDSQGLPLGIGLLGGYPEPTTNRSGFQRFTQWIAWPDQLLPPDKLPTGRAVLTRLNGAALKWVAALEKTLP